MFDFKERYDIHDLVKIVKVLRSENGCPWDKVQTHESIRSSLIEETYEAGIVLTGTEIKSIRNGKCNIKDTYVNIKDGEVFIYGMHISPYEFGNIFNKDPLRTRKLLLNRHEIDKLYGMIKQKGV